MKLARICGIVAFFIAILGAFIYNFTHRDITPQTLTLQDIQDMPEILVGDIVFRQGIGVESDIIQKISNSLYSHIGIVVQTNPVMILHATTDDDLTKPNQVIISTLESFLSRARKIAIKRFDLPSHAYREISTKMQDKYLGKDFILNTTSEAFYCTSLIEEIIGRYVTLEVKYIDVKVPLFNGSYLFPQAFFENTQSLLVYESY